MRNRVIELVVGLFMVLGFLGLLALAFKVSGLTSLGHGQYYAVNADFDNVGDLKVRAPVSVSGVTVGKVEAIRLDPTTLRAHVTLLLNRAMNKIPVDSSASILTQGLLGSNYISLTPGFDDHYLKAGDTLETTHSALILENLIGQLMFNLSNGNKDEKDKNHEGA